MRQFRFVPAYYEWHLLDEENNILHNWPDPVEDLFDEETGEPLPPEEIKWLCSEYLEMADEQYAQGEECNGILLNELQRLDEQEMDEATNVMFKAIIDYYFTDEETPNTTSDKAPDPLPEELPF